MARSELLQKTERLFGVDGQCPAPITVVEGSQPGFWELPTVARVSIVDGMITIATASRNPRGYTFASKHTEFVDPALKPRDEFTDAIGWRIMRDIPACRYEMDCLSFDVVEHGGTFWRWARGGAFRDASPDERAIGVLDELLTTPPEQDLFSPDCVTDATLVIGGLARHFLSPTDSLWMALERVHPDLPLGKAS